MLWPTESRRSRPSPFVKKVRLPWTPLFGVPVRGRARRGTQHGLDVGPWGRCEIGAPSLHQVQPGRPVGAECRYPVSCGWRRFRRPGDAQACGHFLELDEELLALLGTAAAQRADGLAGGRVECGEQGGRAGPDAVVCDRSEALGIIGSIGWDRSSICDCPCTQNTSACRADSGRGPSTA